MERTRTAEKRDRIGFRMFWETTAMVLLAVVLGLLVNQLRPGRLALVGDWSPEAQLTLDSGKNIAISLEEAKELCLSKLGIFIDARSRDLYDQAHILCARNLPWEAVDKSFEAVMADIPPDALIITYCDGESCALSKDLALELFYRGYENVRVLVNGW
ncbi:MAG: rhodanese-like domain-containing protein, partial [Desulfobacteraceae bacterium]|nr:rhodanese-like domain-containing protein [Desulfobacteraceae bacterium]